MRGNEISMIFQEPMTSLNPVMTIGKQIAEALILHRDMDRKAACKRAIEMLDLVRIPEPAQRAKEYPHQLSGGMRQRAMIAMALACNPKVLIADEPTTALDVTIQAQILELIVELQREFSAAVILITHDLGVVAETARRVIVMYAGRKVEEAEVGELFARPLHPYTVGLLASIPRLDLMRGAGRCATPAACRRSRASCRRCSTCPRAAPSRRAATRPTISAAASGPTYEQKRAGHWAACWHTHDAPPPTCPSSRSRTSRSTSRCARACCAAPSARSMPSTASASPSASARRWAWWARAAAARPRPAAPCCA